MSMYINSQETIQISAVGDISLGDHPVCFGHGIRSTIDKKGFPYLFDKTGNAFSDSDIIFGNLETVLPDDTGTTDLFDMEMKGKGEYAASLASTGFNVMSVANNHAMQHGDKAFNETIVNLRNSNISPVGIRENTISNCYLHEKGKIKLAIIAYSYRPEKYSKTEPLYASGNDESIMQQIRQLVSSGYKVIISLHWGEEYLHYPSARQVHLAHSIIDSGASLILGHHPHVLQGIEEYKQGIIIYSLGNFIFDMWQKHTRETMIFRCSIGTDGINSWEVLPVMTNRNYQPVLLTGREADKLLKKIHKYSEGISSDKTVSMAAANSDAYEKIAKKAYNKYRIQSYMYFLKNIYRYKPGVLFNSLSRFIKRRINPEHP